LVATPNRELESTAAEIIGSALVPVFRRDRTSPDRSAATQIAEYGFYIWEVNFSTGVETTALKMCDLAV
jgi:hypothetical protein